MSECPHIKLANGKALKEVKHKRWLAKQQTKQQQQQDDDISSRKRPRSLKEVNDPIRARWIQEHSSVCTWVRDTDVQMLLDEDNNDALSPIGHLLKPYLDLQENDSRRAVCHGNVKSLMFIAEGTETVRLLIQQLIKNNRNQIPPIQIVSIFLKPSVFFDPPVKIQHDVETIIKQSIRLDSDQVNNSNESPVLSSLSNPLPFHVLIGDDEDVLSSVVGFPVSRGAFACGIIPQQRDMTWLLSHLQQHQQQQQLQFNRTMHHHPLRLLALDGITDSANMGSMIRTASAMGIDAILLSHNCCDAWYRRSIRVSMGHIFRIPCVRVDNLALMLSQLSFEPYNIVSYAAVVDPNADLILDTMDKASVMASWCCVMGNEGNGISPAVQDACTHSIRIDMQAGVDSLSVPIAAGILLHGLRERETEHVKDKIVCPKTKNHIKTET